MWARLRSASAWTSVARSASRPLAAGEEGALPGGDGPGEAGPVKPHDGIGDGPTRSAPSPPGRPDDRHGPEDRPDEEQPQ